MKAVVIVISVHLIFGISHILSGLNERYNQASGPRKSVLIPGI